MGDFGVFPDPGQADFLQQLHLRRCEDFQKVWCEKNFKKFLKKLLSFPEISEEFTKPPLRQFLAKMKGGYLAPFTCHLGSSASASPIRKRRGGGNLVNSSDSYVFWQFIHDTFVQNQLKGVHLTSKYV